MRWKVSRLARNRLYVEKVRYAVAWFPEAVQTLLRRLIPSKSIIASSI
jgi:hypothetical protein